MTDVQIAGRGVRDASVLAAMRKVTRARFVAQETAEWPVPGRREAGGAGRRQYGGQ